MFVSLPLFCWKPNFGSVPFPFEEGKICRVWGEENLQISKIFKEICCQWNVIELPPPPLTVNIACNVFSPRARTKSYKWPFVFRRKKVLRE